MESVATFRADTEVRDQLRQIPSEALTMSKTTQRPIVFIGHSLGGLVIKEVALTACYFMGPGA